MIRATIALAATASLAAAQSATVTVEAPSSAAAGSTFTASVVADFDAMGLGDGIFGSAGLFLFGGDVDGTGPATASNIAIDAAFPALQAGGMANAGSVEHVGAGVGAAPAIGGSSATLFTFDVTVDAGAMNGAEIELTYDGAVVLDANNSLILFSSNDPNAMTLNVVGATVTVGTGMCSVADLGAPMGVLDIADVVTFLQRFGAMDPSADLGAPMGTFDIADVVTFLQVFGAGCP
ncbi:MAG: hypothetical protein CMJ31_12295 [Phycisphaerae bacterium]|nr:hypothetical protein [Phycisphaerae bacterium]